MRTVCMRLAFARCGNIFRCEHNRAFRRAPEQDSECRGFGRRQQALRRQTRFAGFAVLDFPLSLLQAAEVQPTAACSHCTYLLTAPRSIPRIRAISRFE